jgi:transmembrane sensor
VNKKIKNTIIKYFSKSASISELEELSRWLNEEENALLFREFVKINYVIEYGLIDFDTEEEKQKIHAMIRKRQSKRLKSRYIALYKYAAAAVLIIASTYLLRDIYFDNSVKDIPVLVKTNIEPGTDKATLTLGDGTHVLLEKGQDLKTQNANSNGKEIVYEASEIHPQETVYNYLTIPRGGQYRIVLSDKTEVWLNSESQLKFPVTFIKGETRKVELVYGEAYFDVSPSNDNNGAKFKVVNQSQVVEVLGTEFNLKAYKDEDQIYTTLVEGKVAIHINGEKQNLLPDQQAKWIPHTNSFSINTDVNVYNEISWKNGVFSFDGKSLKEIMKIVSRWYDVEVFFLDKKVETTRFVGVIRKNRKLEDILINIKNFGIIKDYEINDKRVILK